MAESVADGLLGRASSAGTVRTSLDRLAQPLMRLPRTALLGRLAGAHAPRVVLLEAPMGYGKSWLIRKAAPSGVLRLRGELGPLADDEWSDPGGRVVIEIAPGEESYTGSEANGVTSIDYGPWDGSYTFPQS